MSVMFALQKFITGFLLSNFRLSALVSCHGEELCDTKREGEVFPLLEVGIFVAQSCLYIQFLFLGLICF